VDTRSGVAVQLGEGEGTSARLTRSHWKNIFAQKHHTGFRNSTYNLERPLERKMDLIFGTWNFRSLYRAGALWSVTSEIEKYRMDLLKEVKWEGNGYLQSGNYSLFYEQYFYYHQLGTRLFMRIETDIPK
jgi:hypothetical protein